MEAIMLVAVGLFIYFIPSFVAQKKKNYEAILVLNLFIGWTGIGWLICLVWALTKD